MSSHHLPDLWQSRMCQLRASKPVLPWNVLAWMFVGILSFCALSALGLAVAWIAPGIASNSRPNPESIAWFSPGNRTPAPIGVDPGFIHLTIPQGVSVKSFILDGEPKQPTRINERLWRLNATPGPHVVHVIYESSPGRRERIQRDRPDSRGISASRCGCHSQYLQE